MSHVVIMQPVTAALGDILPRESLIAVLNRLYDQLSNHVDRYRGQCDPEDPDLFDYFLWFSDGDEWRTFPILRRRSAGDGLSLRRCCKSS